MGGPGTQYNTLQRTATHCNTLQGDSGSRNGRALFCKKNSTHLFVVVANEVYETFEKERKKEII